MEFVRYRAPCCRVLTKKVHGKTAKNKGKSMTTVRTALFLLSIKPRVYLRFFLEIDLCFFVVYSGHIVNGTAEVSAYTSTPDLLTHLFSLRKRLSKMAFKRRLKAKTVFKWYNALRRPLLFFSHAATRVHTWAYRHQLATKCCVL